MQSPTIFYIHGWPCTPLDFTQVLQSPSTDTCIIIRSLRRKKNQTTALSSWEPQRFESVHIHNYCEIIWKLLFQFVAQQCIQVVFLTDWNGCKKRNIMTEREGSQPWEGPSDVTQAKRRQHFKSSTWEFLGQEADKEHTSSRIAVCSLSPKDNSSDGELLND